MTAEPKRHLDKASGSSPRTFRQQVRSVGAMTLPFVAAAAVLSVGFIRPRADFILLLRLDHLSFQVDRMGDSSHRLALFDPVDMRLQLAGFRLVELGAGAIAPIGTPDSHLLSSNRVSLTDIVPNGPLP